MKASGIVAIASILILIGAAAFIAYGVWFCASALHGDPQGCIASAGGAALTSPPILIAVTAAGAGLIYATTRRR